MPKKAPGIAGCINRGVIMIDCGEVIRELLMENPACLLHLESENQQNI